jgi:hypothetical protein
MSVGVGLRGGAHILAGEESTSNLFSAVVTAFEANSLAIFLCRFDDTISA